MNFHNEVSQEVLKKLQYPRDFHLWKKVNQPFTDYIIIESPTKYQALIHLIDNDVVQIYSPQHEVIYEMKPEKIPLFSHIKYFIKKIVMR